MISLAKKYGLSDNGLRKVCWKYNIPTPAAGHWAKQAHGHATKSTPLHNPQHDPQIEIYPHFAGHQIEDKQQWERAQKLIADELLDVNAFVVLPTLQDPDSVIVRTAKSLKSAATDQDGLCRPRAKNCLDVHVSKQSTDRAMSVCDALLKGMRKRGFQVSVGSSDARKVTVNILGEAVCFNLEEMLDRKEKNYSAEERRQRTQYPMLYRRPVYVGFPSGKLRLKIHDNGYALEGLRQTWADGKKQQLESCLNSFVVGLIRASVVLRNAKIESERRERERREAEQRYQERAKLRYAEEQKLKNLEQQVAAWLKSRDIRDFLEAVKQNYAHAGLEIAAGSEAAEWLAWVKQQADRFDPLVKSPPSILDESIW